MSEKTLTIGQAAAIVGVSHFTIRRWVKDGILASIKSESGHNRFSREDVERVRLHRPHCRCGLPTLGNIVDKWLTEGLTVRLKKIGNIIDVEASA